MTKRDLQFGETTTCVQTPERDDTTATAAAEMNACEAVFRSMTLDRSSILIDREQRLFIRNKSRRPLSRSSSIF